MKKRSTVWILSEVKICKYILQVCHIMNLQKSFPFGRLFCDSLPLGSCYYLDNFVEKKVEKEENELPERYWSHLVRMKSKLGKMCTTELNKGLLPVKDLGMGVSQRMPNPPAYQFWLKALQMSPNSFANHICRCILKECGCAPQDIHITPNQDDFGIDYWGITQAQSELLPSRLIAGQVKRYDACCKEGRPDIQGFYGAVLGEFGHILPEAYCNNVVLQYVTTGSCSKQAVQYAERIGLQILTIPLLQQCLKPEKYNLSNK